MSNLSKAEENRLAAEAAKSLIDAIRYFFKYLFAPVLTK